MDRFDAYLDLLSQEEDYLDRLLDLAKHKKEAILASDADRIVSVSNAEDSILDVVVNLRKRRRVAMTEFHDRIGKVTHPHQRGRLRQMILEEAPIYVRVVLKESMGRYEAKLLQLRRAAKINNTLLSDRLRIIQHSLETVVSSVKPKSEYDPAGAKSPRRKAGASAATPSFLVDQKV